MMNMLYLIVMMTATSLWATRAAISSHTTQPNQGVVRNQGSSLLHPRGGSSGPSFLRTQSVHHVDKIMNATASRVRSKLVSGRIKAFLSILCGLSIAIELGEEMFENIPVLKHFHRHVHLAHGVLLLTLSHLLHSLFELIDEIEKHSEIKEQRLKLQEVRYINVYGIES